MRCQYCGMLGHDPKHCVAYFALTKNGEQVKCEYGEWLKASGGRPRSPTRQSTRMPQTSIEVHEVEESCRDAVERVTGAGCTESEILSVQGRREEGNFKKLGVDLDSNRIRAEKEGNIDTDMVRVNSDLGGNEYPILNSKIESNVEDLKLIEESHKPSHVSEHVENNISEGLARPTWKRLAHMVYGPANSNEINLPVLGKRGTMQKEEYDGGDSDEQVQKCEKMDMQITQKTNAAGVSNHPRRAQ